MSETVEQHSQESVIRRKKLSELRTQTSNPFPNDFRRTATTQALNERLQGMSQPELEQQSLPSFALAGRLMAKRVLGKSVFLKLADGFGDIQLYCAKSEAPDSLYQSTVYHLEVGDIVGATGSLFKTKTNELTLRLTEIRLLTKALRPLPDKFHGVQDTEVCYRQRYLDLIMNSKTREVFLLRSKLISALREFLTNAGYLEVETPMLQTLAGGAAARPFVTHHNALGIPLYLRIAPELFLKRLVVGGFERVFEINRNFRNEGLSTRHNPEFTMCEFYAAYSDYQDLMEFTEALLQFLAQQTLNSLQFTRDGHDYDLAKPFERISLADAVARHFRFDARTMSDAGALLAHCRSLGLSPPANATLAYLQYVLFESEVETQLIEPTFITDYPAEVSPLARRNPEKPWLAERFELFVGGRELANGFSELNDPEEQATCFKKQVEAKRQGDLEAMPYDVDYIAALEQGLPPTAGEGIGIDRLVMWFTGCPSIKEVILFPTMKPLTAGAAASPPAPKND